MDTIVEKESHKVIIISKALEAFLAGYMLIKEINTHLVMQNFIFHGNGKSIYKDCGFVRYLFPFSIITMEQWIKWQPFDVTSPDRSPDMS